MPYSGSVSGHEFNLGDDYHAYFVFPNKMLQIGSLGSDPFSERRLVSALGGQPFWHTFSLSLLDERSLYLIAPGCALVVMIGLIIGYCQQKKVSKSSTLLIVFGFLSISRSHINISGILIPVCLLFSLFRVFEWENLKATNIQSNVAIVGLLAAAIKKPGQSNNYLDNLASGLSNLPLVTLDEGEKYSKMLDSVPEGEIVLTRLEKPFLMNFKKHTIWIADWPGGASLPPGMPSFKGEDALADYLVSQSIRYVA